MPHESMSSITKPPRVYDSAHKGTPQIDELRELLAYRNLVVQLVRRDVTTRYKRSVLGIAWTMLNPLGTTLILTIVFSQVFDLGKQYAAFALCGLVLWNFFSQSTNAAIVNLVWGGDLLKRIYIPRTIFAVSSIGTALVNLGIALIPLFIIMIFTGVNLKLTLLLIPLPILFLAMFALGVGLLVSSIAVFYADVAEMYQVILLAWLYLTPIIYPITIIPENLRWIIQLNPMYYFVTLFRIVVLDGRVPSLTELLVTAAIGSVSLLVGWLVFTNKADEFAYRI